MGQLTAFKARQIASDLMLESAMPPIPRSNRMGKEWEMLFYPEQYWRDHPGLTIASCTLTEAKLLEYAKQLTKMRTAVRAEAAKHLDSYLFTEPEIVSRVD